jgi:hypothetical protein
LKLGIGRCPESSDPLTISRLENAPKKTDAARLTGALVNQCGASVAPGKEEIFDIDDAFLCTAYDGPQLAFWNAHEEERGFSPMHTYHMASRTPIAVILRPARGRPRERG